MGDLQAIREMAAAMGLRGQDAIKFVREQHENVRTERQLQHEEDDRAREEADRAREEAGPAREEAERVRDHKLEMIGERGQQ